MVVYIPIHSIDTTFALGVFADTTQAKTAIVDWLLKGPKHTVVKEYMKYREDTGNKNSIDDSILDEADQEEFWQNHGIHFTLVQTEFGKLFNFDDYDEWDSGNLYHLLECLLNSTYLAEGDRFNHKL